MSSQAAMLAQLHALLRGTYGLDLSRGGTDRSLAEYVAARVAELDAQRDDADLDLVERVLTNVEGERERLIHAVTVHHTWFFRDPAQLEQVADHLQARHRELERTLDVWVVGCATGEEAWSLAMIARTFDLPIRLLASDVDALAIADAQAACYREARLHGLPPAMLEHFEDLGGGNWRLDIAALLGERSVVEFAVHNLCDPPPPGRSFDLICCRNVLIYFEFERASSSAALLRTCLRPGGRLVLGSADLLTEPRARPDPATPIPAAAARVRAPPSAPAASPSLISAKLAPAEAERLEPNHLTILRASEAIAAGRPDTALALLEGLAAEDPMQAEAQFWIGLAHHQGGRPELASAAFRRALCLAPELWPAHLFAALAHERMADRRSAQRCWAALERALRDPRAAPIRASVALIEALPDWRGEALALARLRSPTSNPWSPNQ